MYSVVIFTCSTEHFDGKHHALHMSLTIILVDSSGPAAQLLVICVTYNIPRLYGITPSVTLVTN